LCNQRQNTSRVAVVSGTHVPQQQTGIDVSVSPFIEIGRYDISDHERGKKIQKTRKTRKTRWAAERLNQCPALPKNRVIGASAPRILKECAGSRKRQHACFVPVSADYSALDLFIRETSFNLSSQAVQKFQRCGRTTGRTEISCGPSRSAPRAE
jgi:hypothetical protein